MEWTDWARIISRLQQIPAPKAPLFSTLGWASAPVAIATWVTYVTIGAEQPVWVKTAVFCVAIAASAVAPFAFIVARRERDTFSNSIESVIDEMQHMASKHRNASTASASANNAAATVVDVAV
jgi:hypothetical protein